MNKTHLINKAVSKVVHFKDKDPISKVIVKVDDETGFVAGDDTGSTFVVTVPSGTQAMADAILAKAKGFVYRSFRADRATIAPDAELGDGIYVDGVYTMLADKTLRFTNSGYSDVAAPGSEETPEGQKYAGALWRETQKAVKQHVKYYGTQIDRVHGLRVTKTDEDGTEMSRAQLNSDVLAFYDDEGNPSIYFDVNDHKYKFVGDVTVTGGSININDNFVVDRYGNVKMSGVIEWGDYSPYQSQFSVDGKTDWHYGMTDSDYYRRDSYDAGQTWGEAYKFRGQDGEDGSDANVPRYIKKTYISSVEIQSPTITGNEIRALGSFQVGYGSADSFVGTGFMGYAMGLGAGNTVTYGVALSNTESLEEGDNYIIVTNGGSRMQGGYNNIFVTPDVVGIEAAIGAVVRITVGAKEFEFTEDGFYIDGTKIG